MDVINLMKNDVNLLVGRKLMSVSVKNVEPFLNMNNSYSTAMMANITHCDTYDSHSYDITYEYLSTLRVSGVFYYYYFPLQGQQHDCKTISSSLCFFAAG